NRASLCFHQVLRDEQAESEAADTPGRAAVGLSEALEHVREKRRVDAAAAVGHLNLDRAPSENGADRDPTSLRREFHRVGEEVEEDLLEPARIGHERCVGERIETKVDAFAL